MALLFYMVNQNTNLTFDVFFNLLIFDGGEWVDSIFLLVKTIEKVSF